MRSTRAPSCSTTQTGGSSAGVLNNAQKKLDLLNEDKTEERVAIDSISDIFSHADQIKATVRWYEGAIVKCCGSGFDVSQ